MNSEHSKIIIFLLAVIAAVMLFGRDAVISGGGVLFLIGLVIAVIGFIAYLITSFFETFIDEIRTNKQQGMPWISLFFIWPGIIGSCLICLYVLILCWNSNEKFSDALQQVALWWVPVSLMGIGYLVSAIESFKDWGPKLPKRILRNCSDFLNWWKDGFTAPIRIPRIEWQKIQLHRKNSSALQIARGLLILCWETFFGLLHFCFVIIGICILGLFIALVLHSL